MRRTLVIIGMSVLSALFFYTSSVLTHAQATATRQTFVPSTSAQNRMPIGTRITADDRDGFEEFELNDFRAMVAEQNAAQREASSASAAASSSNASSRSDVPVTDDDSDVPLFKPDSSTSTSASSAADTVNTESKQPTRGCGGQRPTFLELFDDDDLFCSTRGEVFPVLIGGECPITTCVIKSGRKVWPGDDLSP